MYFYKLLLLSFSKVLLYAQTSLGTVVQSFCCPRKSKHSPQTGLSWWNRLFHNIPVYYYYRIQSWLCKIVSYFKAGRVTDSMPAVSKTCFCRLSVSPMLQSFYILRSSVQLGCTNACSSLHTVSRAACPFWDNRYKNLRPNLHRVQKQSLGRLCHAQYSDRCPSGGEVTRPLPFFLIYAK